MLRVRVSGRAVHLEVRQASAHMFRSLRARRKAIYNAATGSDRPITNAPSPMAPGFEVL